MSKLFLKVESLGKKAEKKSVPANGLTLGRGTENTIVVPDDTTVSARHLRVDLTDQGMIVQDLKSSNGTKVNGKNIGNLPYRLKVGDVIQAGKTKITVIEGSESSASGRFKQVLADVGKKLKDVTGKLFGGEKKKGEKEAAAEPGFALCPKCGTKIHVGVKAKGSKVGCPHCKEVFPLQ